MDPEQLMSFFAFSVGPDGFPPRNADELQVLLDRWLTQVEVGALYEARTTADWILDNVHFVASGGPGDNRARH